MRFHTFAFSHQEVPNHQPFSPTMILRICVVLIILLSLAAGYYQALYRAEQKKYLRLEDKYVRVRGELGREETQRLIDSSYLDQ